MSCTSGNQMKIAFKEGATADFSSGATQLIIESESLRKNETQIDLSGLKGSRTRTIEEVAEGPYNVSGSIILKPSAGALDLLLPWILGADESTDVFDVAETLQSFSVLINRVATMTTRSTFKYEGLKVNRAIFRGSQGQPVRLELQVLGIEEEADSDAFPTLTLGTGLGWTPYVFHESTFQYGSTVMSYRSFELTIDNAIEQRGENAITVEDNCEQDRIITARFDCPWQTSHGAEYDVAPKAGVLSLVKSGDAVSTIFQFGRCVQIAQAPTIGGKGRIPWNLQFDVRSTGATPDLQVLNDSAP